MGVIEVQQVILDFLIVLNIVGVVANVWLAKRGLKLAEQNLANGIKNAEFAQQNLELAQKLGSISKMHVLKAEHGGQEN